MCPIYPKDLPQKLCFHGNNLTLCKQNNNYRTVFATISQNADSKHQVLVNGSNFGTVGKLTTWRRGVCLESRYSTLHKLNKSVYFSKTFAYYPLSWLVFCVYTLDCSTTIATEKLMKILGPNNFILPSTKGHKVTLFTRLALCNWHMNLMLEHPEHANSKLLANLKVDFRKFCAEPSREWRYKVSSPIFRQSDLNAG